MTLRNVPPAMAATPAQRTSACRYIANPLQWQDNVTGRSKQMAIFKRSGLAQHLAKCGVSVTDRPPLDEATLHIAKFWIEERPLEAVRVHHGQVAVAPDRLLLGGEHQA